MKRLMSFFKWRRWVSVAICTVLISLSIFTVSALASDKAKAPRKVTFFGAPTSAISSGVSLPKNVGLYYSSGTVPPVIDSTAPAGSRERYGDTYTQAVGTLKRIEELLVEQGLTLNDVVYLTAYLVPDPLNNNQPDYQGWFRAYGEFFNTTENPVKTARSTVGVQSLVISDWLIEIEAIAAFPK